MSDQRPRRVLVVTDHSAPHEPLTAAMAARAADGPAQFRLIVLNPARAELHLLHPERHDKAAEAEVALRENLPTLERAAGAGVVGSVSVRHDPLDAVEEVLFSEPVDEIIVAVPGHRLATWLHQDLPHRLQHFGLPVSSVVD
jgi:hypothetical protein